LKVVVLAVQMGTAKSMKVETDECCPFAKLDSKWDPEVIAYSKEQEVELNKKSDLVVAILKEQ
jgi:galactose-1-phosphate uridylyltransferase